MSELYLLRNFYVKCEILLNVLDSETENLYGSDIDSLIMIDNKNITNMIFLQYERLVNKLYLMQCVCLEIEKLAKQDVAKKTVYYSDAYFVFSLKSRYF